MDRIVDMSTRDTVSIGCRRSLPDSRAVVENIDSVLVSFVCVQLCLHCTVSSKVNIGTNSSDRDTAEEHSVFSQCSS